MAATIDNFLKLRPQLREVREQDDGWIVGKYSYNPNLTAEVSQLAELYNEGVVSEIKSGGQRIFLQDLKDSAELNLMIDPGKLPGYFESYDSLIKAHPDEAPPDLVVWEKNDLFQAGYLAACNLISLLKTKAEVWDATQRRLFLVDQQAIEIPLVSYAAAQRAGIAKQLVELSRFLNVTHLDADARWAFFRKSALRLLRDLPKDVRMGALMENLETLFDRARHDHSLYLERFSFEDLLKNFDEKRLKFVGDINQILASIQGALIGVPIGFFLIAEKFKPSDGLLGQNIVMATGGAVFFALLIILSFNQGKSLEGIRLALLDFETEQTKKVTDQSDRLKRLLASTWSQFRLVKTLLMTVRILLFIFTGVIIVAFIWCSVPAWQHALPYSSHDSTAATNGISPMQMSTVVEPSFGTNSTGSTNTIISVTIGPKSTSLGK